MATTRLSVSGMACSGCEEHLVASLEAVTGVGAVSADHERGIVEFETTESVADEIIAAAIEDAGYALAT